MEKMNPNIYMVIGLVLIAVSIPLAAGMITHWPASTETWENTEILGAYGPKYLSPGEQLKTITVAAMNGYIKNGEVLIDVHVQGDANGCRAWQFTPYLRAGVPENVSLSFYREIPVMGDAPMVFTVEPGFYGTGAATLTVYPLGDPVENTTDTDGILDDLTDLIDDILNPGNETDTTTDDVDEDDTTSSEDSDEDSDDDVISAGGEELAIIKYLQTLAPRLTVETLTMGIVTMMLGLGLSGYGFSMRDQW